MWEIFIDSSLAARDMKLQYTLMNIMVKEIKSHVNSWIREYFSLTFSKIEKYEILDKKQAYKYAIISMKIKLCFY